MLRIMTYNILDGGIDRKQKIAAVLQHNQPDVVVFQEVFTAEFANDLARTLGMQAFFATGNTKRHLALLSKFPITFQRSNHPFPPIQRTILEAEIELAPGKRFRVYGIHIVPWYSVLLELWRWWEVKVITQQANEHSQQPCVILGDFNTIAPADNINLQTMPLFLRLMVLIQGQRVYRFAIREMLSAGFVDCFRALHPSEAGYTLPPPLPNARLDYIFVNTAMRPYLRNCGVVNAPSVVEEASDHYPLMADFEL